MRNPALLTGIPIPMNTIVGSLGTISSHPIITTQKTIRTQLFTAVFTAMFSLIQLSELEQCGVNELAQGLTQQHIRIRVILGESPKL